MNATGRRLHGTTPVLAISFPLLGGCGVLLLYTTSVDLWTPLTGLLAVCAVIGTRVSFDIEGTLFWDGSFLPIICTAALLGPVPTVAVTLLSELAVWRAERYRLKVLPVNLVGTVVPNLVAAGVLAGLGDTLTDAAFYGLLTAVVCASVALNAILITALAGVLYDAPIVERLRRHRGIVAPIAVNVVLAVGAVAVYRAEGVAATAFVIGGVYVFAFVANRLAADRDQRTRITELADSRGRLVAQILEAEDRERRVLADALHDDLIQTLVAARQDAAEEPGEPSGLARLDEAIGQARQLIRATHPSVLDRVGLEAAIRAIGEQASSRGRFQLALELDSDAMGPHDRLVFSATRELLANAAKHSGAAHVVVRLKQLQGRVELTVTDDGVGFAVSDPIGLVDAGHIGLESLRERMEAVGGNLQLRSSASGAEIVASVPGHRRHRTVGAMSITQLTSVGED